MAKLTAEELAKHWAVTPAFPMQFEEDGDLKLALDEQAIGQNLEVTLMSSEGDWYKFPTAGSKLAWLNCDPTDDITKRILDFHTRSTITQAEPRAQFSQVVTEFDSNAVNMKIPFTVLATGRSRSVDVGFPLGGGA